MVFGSSRVAAGSADWELARAVGEQIGRRGLTLVSGGYDGSMGAASEGCAAAGGRVVGITTPIFRGRRANAHVHEERSEADYPARMSALLRAGEGFVALPGALGTASEWITAWCLATIDQLGGPLWMFEEPWRPVAEGLSGLPELELDHHRHLRWVADPEAFGAELDRWRAAAAG